MKTCQKCQKTKPLEEFTKNKECKDGRTGTCQQCTNERSNQWKRDNRERILAERRAAYAADNGAAVKAREKRRYEREPFRVRAQKTRKSIDERARQSGIPFDRKAITAEYLLQWFMTTPSCECCGKSLDYQLTDVKYTGPKHNTPSIDRIIPALGYVIGNIALLCWRCNNLKRDATADELQQIADWMRTLASSRKKE